jgi:hypothetical protein
MWVAVADCCLLLKLKLSPTPGLSIDCVASSNLNVASPLRAATERFILFLVVVSMLAHGFDMLCPVHSEVLSQ